MIEYKKMYFTLFNRITQATEEIERGDTARALETLKQAQTDTEEMYIMAGEKPED